MFGCLVFLLFWLIIFGCHVGSKHVSNSELWICIFVVFLVLVSWSWNVICVVFLSKETRDSLLVLDLVFVLHLAFLGLIFVVVFPYQETKPKTTELDIKNNIKMRLKSRKSIFQLAQLCSQIVFHTKLAKKALFAETTVIWVSGITIKNWPNMVNICKLMSGPSICYYPVQVCYAR